MKRHQGPTQSDRGGRNHENPAVHEATCFDGVSGGECDSAVWRGPGGRSSDDGIGRSDRYGRHECPGIGFSGGHTEIVSGENSKGCQCRTTTLGRTELSGGRADKKYKPRCFPVLSVWSLESEVLLQPSSGAADRLGDSPVLRRNVAAHASLPCRHL